METSAIRTTGNGIGRATASAPGRGKPGVVPIEAIIAGGVSSVK